MAPFQSVGTGWIPERHLLYLAVQIYVLKERGKDGSKQFPRVQSHSKAHEKRNFRRDLKEERKIISGTERHSLFHMGNDEQDYENQFLSSSHIPVPWVQSYLFTGCRRSCLMATSHSPGVPCILETLEEEWPKCQSNFQSTANESSLEEDANNGSLQQNCKSLASSPF